MPNATTPRHALAALLDGPLAVAAIGWRDDSDRGVVSDALPRAVAATAPPDAVARGAAEKALPAFRLGLVFRAAGDGFDPDDQPLGVAGHRFAPPSGRRNTNWSRRGLNYPEIRV